MSIDYIVSSLPALSFDEKPAITLEQFLEMVNGIELELAKWQELETELKNALAEARGGKEWQRESSLCSLYWRTRVQECFRESDVLKRETKLDQVWWDAAGELTSPISPLGRGALTTYYIRLKIALKRSKINVERGNQVFDHLTKETRL